MKTPALRKQPATGNFHMQRMFRPVGTAGRNSAGEFFFTTTPLIQRQEATASPAEEKKEPLLEGLKTTGEQLLKLPAFKAWYEPRVEQLKVRLWEEQPSDTKAALITFGGLNLALAGLVFALNPEMREMLSGANIGAPLGWIPYSPIEGFKYTLHKPGTSAYGFSADFTLNPYLKALREKHPNMPLTGLTFGLESSYNPAGSGLSVSGGKFGMEFFGGGLTLAGKSFTELSPYPMFLPGSSPVEPPSTLMQSVPGFPPLPTGQGFQVMLSADLLKLFPRLRGVF